MIVFDRKCENSKKCDIAGFCIYFFYGMKHSVENAVSQLPKSTTYDTMVVTPATTPGGSEAPKPDMTYEKPQPVEKKH